MAVQLNSVVVMQANRSFMFEGKLILRPSEVESNFRELTNGGIIIVDDEYYGYLKYLEFTPKEVIVLSKQTSFELEEDSVKVFNNKEDLLDYLNEKEGDSVAYVLGSNYAYQNLLEESKVLWMFQLDSNIYVDFDQSFPDIGDNWVSTTNIGEKADLDARIRSPMLLTHSKYINSSLVTEEQENSEDSSEPDNQEDEE